MVSRPQGREKQWAIELTGTDGVAYPFMVARQNGAPIWNVQRVPDIEGQRGGVQFEERAYRSTHSGAGWGQYLAPNTYHYGTNVDPRFPMQIIMGPLVTSVEQSSKDATVGVTGFAEGAMLYSISGKYVNRIDPTDDTVSATGGWPKDLTSVSTGAVGTVGVLFDSKIIFGVTSASGASMISFDGTSTWTELTDAGPPGDGNVPKGVYLVRYWEDTSWRLGTVFVKSSQPCLSWIAPGAILITTENWTGYAGTSSDYPIADKSSTVTGLAAYERDLYAAMSDGLYAFDGQSGRGPLLIPAMPRKSTNGINLSVSSEGQVWYPCASGLYLYDPNEGTIDNVAPGRGLPDRSGIAGTYTAMAHFRAWTYLSVYDGTDSYIMCGRRREEGEVGFGPYIWHGALAKLDDVKITAMHISANSTPPKLWLGLSTGNLAYIKLPNNGDNPLLDSTYRYAASGSIYFPADDYGLGGMRWNLQDVVLETEGLDSNTTITVYERRDRNSGTAQVETATVLGTIGPAGAGNASAIVTAANMTGSPVTVAVAVANDDTASQVAGKIRTALAAHATVGAFFSISGSGADVVATVKNVVADDATMNIRIDNGTCTGLTNAPTSTNTTAGVDSWTSLQTISSNGRTVISTSGDKRFNRCELRLDFVNNSPGGTPVARILVGKASRRPTKYDVIQTTLLCSDDVFSELGIQSRYTGAQLEAVLNGLDNYSPTTLVHYWTGSRQSKTVLVTSVDNKRIVRQDGDFPGGWAIDVTMRVIS